MLRIHGGEASPTISRVLEQAAIANDTRVEDGLRRAMAEIGRPLPAAAE